MFWLYKDIACGPVGSLGSVFGWFVMFFSGGGV